MVKFEHVTFGTNSSCGIIPRRSTSGAAGYDFVSPERVVIAPGEKKKIATGIKAKMSPGIGLFIIPRSSMGIKHDLHLANDVALIDSDYYNNPDNDGNIIICLHNYGRSEEIVEIGDRVAQGIFVGYYIVEDDDTSEERVGGIGSTGV